MGLAKRKKAQKRSSIPIISCPLKEECWLPKDNRRYGFQFVYSLVGLIFLFFGKENFKFFPVALFLTPFLIDLAYTEARNKLYTIARWSLIVLNTVLLLGCMFGLIGVLESRSDIIYLSPSFLYYTPNLYVTKKVIGYFITADLLVPVIHFVGVPNQKTMLAIVMAGKMKGKLTGEEAKA